MRILEKKVRLKNYPSAIFNKKYIFSKKYLNRVYVIVYITKQNGSRII